MAASGREGVPLAADGVELSGDGSGNLQARVVGDEGDLFVGLDAQASSDRIARAVGVLGREGNATQLEDRLGCVDERGVRRRLQCGFGGSRDCSAGISVGYRTDRFSLSRCLHVVIVR